MASARAEAVVDLPVPGVPVINRFGFGRLVPLLPLAMCNLQLALEENQLRRRKIGSEDNRVLRAVKLIIKVFWKYLFIYQNNKN